MFSDTDPKKLARAADPETSHAAAAKVKSGTVREHVYKMMLEADKAMTHEQIVARYKHGPGKETRPLASESSIRTRVSELFYDGKVALAGFGETEMGNPARKWRAIEAEDAI